MSTFGPGQTPDGHRDRPGAAGWLRRAAAGAQRPAVLVMAFGGWHDAGAAATGAVSWLAGSGPSERVRFTGGVPPVPGRHGGAAPTGAWHDLRVHRPVAEPGPDGRRRVRWPRLTLTRVSLRSGLDLLAATGPEPDVGWDGIAAGLLAAAAEEGAVAAVGLGARSAETPHTLPLPLEVSSEDASVREELGASAPPSKGTLGFLDVVLHTADAAGWPTALLSVGVPSYAAAPPQPAAGLRLLRTLEHWGEFGLDLRAPEADAQAWIHGADRLMDSDRRIAALVRSWEAERDVTELPEARGDAIAAEFERYLRGRGPEA